MTTSKGRIDGELETEKSRHEKQRQGRIDRELETEKIRHEKQRQKQEVAELLQLDRVLR